jgi:hypothetical protein
MPRLLFINTQYYNAHVCVFCPAPFHPSQNLIIFDFKDDMVTKEVQPFVSCTDITKLIEEIKYAHNAWTLSNFLFGCNAVGAGEML